MGDARQTLEESGAKRGVADDDYSSVLKKNGLSRRKEPVRLALRHLNLCRQNADLYLALFADDQIGYLKPTSNGATQEQATGATASPHLYSKICTRSMYCTWYLKVIDEKP